MRLIDAHELNKEIWDDKHRHIFSIDSLPLLSRLVDEQPAHEVHEATKVVVGENGNEYCPRCANKIGFIKPRRYCCDCGQKLDWSVTNG
jgi:hypothetical protein